MPRKAPHFEVRLTSPLPFAEGGERKAGENLRRVDDLNEGNGFSPIHSSNVKEGVRGNPLRAFLIAQLATTIRERWQVDGPERVMAEAGYEACFATHVRLSIRDLRGELNVANPGGYFVVMARNMAPAFGRGHKADPDTADCNPDWHLTGKAAANRLAWYEARQGKPLDVAPNDQADEQAVAG